MARKGNIGTGKKNDPISFDELQNLLFGRFGKVVVERGELLHVQFDFTRKQPATLILDPHNERAEERCTFTVSKVNMWGRDRLLRHALAGFWVKIDSMDERILGYFSLPPEKVEVASEKPTKKMTKKKTAEKVTTKKGKKKVKKKEVKKKTPTKKAAKVATIERDDRTSELEASFQAALWSSPKVLRAHLEPVFEVLLEGEGPVQEVWRCFLALCPGDKAEAKLAVYRDLQLVLSTFDLALGVGRGEAGKAKAHVAECLQRLEYVIQALKTA